LFQFPLTSPEVIPFVGISRNASCRHPRKLIDISTTKADSGVTALRFILWVGVKSPDDLFARTDAAVRSNRCSCACYIHYSKATVLRQSAGLIPPRIGGEWPWKWGRSRYCLPLHLR
jgi:hypothetical protein